MAISVLQAKWGYVAGVTSHTLTFDSPTTNGSVIYLAAVVYDLWDIFDYTDITDNNGNTAWQLIGQVQAINGPDWCCGHAYHKNIAGRSSHSVTYTVKPGGPVLDTEMCIVEIGGVDTTAPLRDHNEAKAATTSCSATATDLVMGAGCTATTSMTNDSNFTNIMHQYGENGQGLSLGSRIAGSTTTYTVNTTNAVGSLIASFIQAASAGGPAKRSFGRIIG
jgi:hypothetical protein